MAYSKIILNGETLMDVTSDTVAAGSLLSGKTATKNDGTKVTGNIANKTASDLTANGATVTAAAGYYSSAVSKSVAAGSAFPPAVTITKAPTIGVNTSGVVTATYTGSSSITPTVTSGYVSQGTAGTVSTTGTSTYQLTSKAAATYNTSTADQTIASQRWLVGAQTIKSVTTSNLTAANIKSGTVVKVGDANNASRIAQITGTYAPTISSVTITPTSTTQTFNASGVDGYKPVTVNGDSNLKAENIAEGVSIFGVTGTYAGDTALEDAFVTRTFYNFSNYYENSRVTVVGKDAFANITNLSSIYLPNVSRIYPDAFCWNNMKYISAPKVQLIGASAFCYCINLSSVSFPLVTSIPSSCFYSCSKLQSVFFSNVTEINTDAFRSCSSLTNIYMPNLQTCGYGGYYFRDCTNLSSVNFSKLYSVGSAMFNWCINLHTVSLGNSTITSATFATSVFMVCRNLLSLYLYYGAVPQFGPSMFYGSPISDYTTSTGGVYGSIFVPSSLYNSYITATGWTAYSSRIVSI